MKKIYKGFILLDRYKNYIIATMFLVSLIGGLGIYYFYYELPFVRALRYTTLLFIDTIPDPVVNGKEIILSLEVVSIMAKTTLFLAVIIWFIKAQLESIYRRIIVNEGEHILVIGLDSNSRFFIDNEISKGNENILVVENDEFNPYIDIYRNKAISVLHSELEGVIDKIGIDSAKYIFVSTCNSQENVSNALQIIAKAKRDPNKKLLIRIEDRTLRSLYNDESLLSSDKLDIQPFSFDKESARMLFQEHDIDGDGFDIIDSNKTFEIAVVGNSNLAIEVIVEAIKMAHLPNENRLIINCINSDTSALESRIKFEIPYIAEVKNIELKYIELDYKNIEFYYHNVWQKESLKHIILCQPKAVDNINISTKLKRLTYKGVIDSKVRKIHIATYSSMEIAKEIESGNMFIFASVEKVCKSENLINTEIEKLGKMIQYSYSSNSYNPKAIIKAHKVIDRVWEGKVSINDKRSSIAQAKHLKVKLKALKLGKQKSDKKLEKLAKLNKRLFCKKISKDLEEINLGYKKLHTFSKELDKFYENKEYKQYYFPKEYKTMFEKLLRAEHNRWIAMLVMMDNHYDQKAQNMPSDERKVKKIHHLMKPFNEFKEDERMVILYDIYSIMYIPEYLASLGYELVDLET